MNNSTDTYNIENADFCREFGITMDDVATADEVLFEIDKNKEKEEKK